MLTSSSVSVTEHNTAGRNTAGRNTAGLTLRRVSVTGHITAVPTIILSLYCWAGLQAQWRPGLVQGKAQRGRGATTWRRWKLTWHLSPKLVSHHTAGWHPIASGTGKHVCVTMRFHVPCICVWRHSAVLYLMLICQAECLATWIKRAEVCAAKGWLEAVFTVALHVWC